jgi:hypothetical protein
MAPRRLAAHPVVSVFGNGPRCHPHEHYTSRRFPGMTHQQPQNTKDRTSGETRPTNRWICQKEIEVSRSAENFIKTFRIKLFLLWNR